MTNDPKDPKTTDYHPDVPDEEITNENTTSSAEDVAEREKRIQERIAELRKRDPFIYR